MRPSRFGPMALLWLFANDRPVISRILLSRPGHPAEKQRSFLCPQALPASCRDVDEAAGLMATFLEGEDIRFPLHIVLLAQCTDFQQQVLLTEYRIPRGRVSSYQRIARHLGKPKNARAVGHALATNPFPIIIPCHRAVRSDRTPGGYQGGSAMKRALLEMEGVFFDDSGRISGDHFFY